MRCLGIDPPVRMAGQVIMPLPPPLSAQRPSPRRGCRLSDPNIHSGLAMPDQVLRNPRHERFAQELAARKTADAAYVLAGHKENRSTAKQTD